MTAGSPSARVGLALIAKNEADRLPTLLASIDGAFDRVVLLDTGSTDETKAMFIGWAKTQTGMTFSVSDYEWQDDFAHARSAADELLLYGSHRLTTEVESRERLVDWTCWADCDDIIKGAGNIRNLVAAAPASTVAFMVDYDYARDPESGACLSYLRRERIVRAGHGHWMGRVHEAQSVEGGQMQQVDPAVLLYFHNKHGGADAVEKSNDRNLRILRSWLTDEPDNPRILGYLGVEEALQGNHEEAVGFYRRYLSLPTGWDEERAQVHSRLAMSLISIDRFDEAIATALEAFRVLPSWPDTYVRLAESYLAKGEHAKAEQWARMALERGAPEGTLLIVNPLDYTFQPRKVLAGALGAQGRVHEAIECGKDALSFFPDQSLMVAMQVWQGTAKRERTADTYVMCAEQLVAHDEQLKAMQLLDCVPVFAIDHPKVVGFRSWLRERIDWAYTPVDYSTHYEVGGSKPEDMIPDEQVDELCQMLPRTNFLLDGVCEQLDVS